MRTVRVRNLILGDGNVKICVPVTAAAYGDLERSLSALESSTYDLVEFRADCYLEDEERALSRIRETVGEKPVLYTLRTKEEGGWIDVQESVYRERILKGTLCADLVDIQFARLREDERNGGSDSLLHLAKARGAKVILSWHDFEKTPSKQEIVRRLCAMQQAGCDISKAALMPRSRRDVLALMEASVEMLQEKAVCPFITISMGALGHVTRAGGAFTGSCITFGAAGEASAPGQLPPDTLRMILNAMGGA